MSDEKVKKITLSEVEVLKARLVDSDLQRRRAEFAAAQLSVQNAQTNLQSAERAYEETTKPLDAKMTEGGKYKLLKQNWETGEMTLELVEPPAAAEPAPTAPAGNGRRVAASAKSS